VPELPIDLPADLPSVDPVRSGGVTLSVRRLAPRGAPSETGPGPRLILLHGGPGLDHHVLLPLGLALTEHGEVWLPDLPGHGDSTSPGAAAPPGLGALESRLGRWLRELPAPPGGGGTVAVGHSLGAWLVRELIRSGPSPPPLRAAVLVSPPAAGQRERGTAWRRAGRLARRSGSRLEQRAHREVLAHVEAETSGRIDPLFLAGLARARLRDARLYDALTGELHRRLVAKPAPCDPGLPVLVLCGEEDRTTPPEQAIRVADGLRGARLELLPGAGHYPFADAPEATAGAIGRFLRALGPSPLSAPGS
jgi:magnesium chelatase accessory protein